jgi:hypothetical protein
MQSSAMKAITNIFENRGNTPRLYRNMICFLASDAELMLQLKREMRTLLAWKSVERDSESLNLDSGQRKEVAEAIQTASNNIKDRIQDAYCYLIVPSQEGTEDIIWKESKNTGNSNPVQKSFQRLKQDECLVDAFSPKILSMEMKQFNLWKGKDALSIRELWENYTRYVYLHRIKNQSVLFKTLESGIKSGEYFGYADGQNSEGKYEALIFGPSSNLLITLNGFIVKPEAAKMQIEISVKPSADTPLSPHGGSGDTPPASDPVTPGPQPAVGIKYNHFFGTVELSDLNKIAKTTGDINLEILQHFSKLPKSSITVKLDIDVNIPDGVSDDFIRTISENCRTLKFETNEFDTM